MCREMYEMELIIWPHFVPVWFVALLLAFQSRQVTKNDLPPIYISGGVAARLWLR
jgi:hypothetical protein